MDRDPYLQAKGRVIEALTFTDEVITIGFEDGTMLRLFMGEPSCCENLYFHSDDDLTFHAGAIFQDVLYEEGPTTGDVLESEFLHIETSKGTSTITAYNSHNGYYGGISVRAEFMHGGTF